MQSMLDTLRDPVTRHAMIVHFPIVLGALAFVPGVWWAIRGFKGRAQAVVCVIWLGAAAIGAALAANAGEAAAERVEAAPLSGAAEAALERHEEGGEGLWAWPLAGAGAFAVAGLVAKKPVRIGAACCGVALSLVTGALVARTGHSGGDLVYRHGVGPNVVATVGAPSGALQPPRRGEGAYDDD